MQVKVYDENYYVNTGKILQSLEGQTVISRKLLTVLIAGSTKHIPSGKNFLFYDHHTVRELIARVIPMMENRGMIKSRKNARVEILPN